jgi:DNA polymerase III subunit epsilon
MDVTTALRTAEFLVVDTETNGLAGEACELTEIGAVLVGGGELHERWETLVETRRPLSKGIQRFTGITQEMVDEAPPAEATLPELGELLRGRVLVAHSAAFDRRVLAQAFERAGLDWPDPPALCTVALARRLHPLARQRKLAPLAMSLGIDVDVAHRALADAETCARVFCALFPRLCASAATLGDALTLLGPKRSSRRRSGATDGGALPRRARRRLPDLAGVCDAPGVYIVRNEVGQPLYVGKSVRVRTRVRAHFAPSSPSTAWTARAETVEHLQTATDLGALLLEHRTVRRLRPPGNAKLKHADDWVWIRCRLDIGFPILEVAAAPAPAPAVNVGPLRGRATAAELVEQVVSLFGLRQCGRRLPRREHPSVYGEMGRCLSPCLGDLDPNLYRRRLDAALGVLSGPGDGAPRLLRHVDELIGEASAARQYERAAWLLRRRERLAVLLKRAGRGVGDADRPRLVLDEAPEGGTFEAFWLVRGGVADWGALPHDLDEIAERTAAALRSPGPSDGDALDEARLVSSWAVANQALELELEGGVSHTRLARFLRGAGVDLETAFAVS